LDSAEIIVKLEQSLQNDLGDWGRNQYLIKRIEKNQDIFQSDKKYLDRLFESLQLKIQDRESKYKKPFEKIHQIPLIDNLIKCNYCDVEINLEQKAIRKKDCWFHDKCFEKIEQVTKIAQIQKTDVIHAQKIENYRKSQNIITVTNNVSQIIFTSLLMIALIVSIYLLSGIMFAIMAGILVVGNFIILYASGISKLFHKETKHGKTNESTLIKTGIPGFESLISNGLKKNNAILISGPPGSGKTTFGLQFLYSGAKDFDEPGVYITLSQNIEEIKNDCKSFGWDFDDLINKDKILMIDARPFKIQDETIGRDDSLYRGEQIPFAHLTKLLSSSIKRVEAKRVVIDSVTILAMQYSDKFSMRQGLQGMIQALENYGVTSLIISEFSENNEIPLEWFVASGIIQMDCQTMHNTVRRTIQIKKLRGIKHNPQIHIIELGINGLHIFEAR